MKPLYAKTWSELADLSGESTGCLSKYKRLPGWPRKTQRGWNVERILSHINSHREEYAAKLKERGSGALDELRAEKLGIEIDLAKEKLGQIRGETIAVSEMLDQFTVLAGIVNGVFSQFESNVAAITGDASLLTELERLTTSARQSLADACGEAAA
jgi:hypothetical protein